LEMKVSGVGRFYLQAPVEEPKPRARKARGTATGAIAKRMYASHERSAVSGQRSAVSPERSKERSQHPLQI
jgi:hypothetical protein